MPKPAAFVTTKAAGTVLPTDVLRLPLVALAGEF